MFIRTPGILHQITSINPSRPKLSSDSLQGDNQITKNLMVQWTPLGKQLPYGICTRISCWPKTFNNYLAWVFLKNPTMLLQGRKEPYTLIMNTHICAICYGLDVSPRSTFGKINPNVVLSTGNFMRWWVHIYEESTLMNRLMPLPGGWVHYGQRELLRKGQVWAPLASLPHVLSLFLSLVSYRHPLFAIPPWDEATRRTTTDVGSLHLGLPNLQNHEPINFCLL